MQGLDAVVLSSNQVRNQIDQLLASFSGYDSTCLSGVVADRAVLRAQHGDVGRLGVLSRKLLFFDAAY